MPHCRGLAGHFWPAGHRLGTTDVNRYSLMEPSRKSHAIELSLFLWRNARWRNWECGYSLHTARGCNHQSFDGDDEINFCIRYIEISTTIVTASEVKSILLTDYGDVLIRENGSRVVKPHHGRSWSTRDMAHDRCDNTFKYYLFHFRHPYTGWLYKHEN